MKKSKKSGSRKNREKRRTSRQRSARASAKLAAGEKRQAVRQSGGLDTERIEGMNEAMAQIHQSLGDLDLEFLAIQEELGEMDRADIACIQAAMLIAHAQEYTRCVLMTAPVQLRGVGKDFIFKRAQDMREQIFQGKGAPKVAMEAAPNAPDPTKVTDDQVRRSEGGIILLGGA